MIAFCDEPARFAIGDASIDVSSTPEWLSVRAGHQPFILVTPTRTMIGAIDVPEAGYTEVHLTPKDRSLRLVVHRP